MPSPALSVVEMGSKFSPGTEQEVLQWLAAGLTVREAAKRIGAHERTVRNWRRKSEQMPASVRAQRVLTEAHALDDSAADDLADSGDPCEVASRLWLHKARHSTPAELLCLSEAMRAASPVLIEASRARARMVGAKAAEVVGDDADVRDPLHIEALPE